MVLVSLVISTVVTVAPVATPDIVKSVDVMAVPGSVVSSCTVIADVADADDTVGAVVSTVIGVVLKLRLLSISYSTGSYAYHQVVLINKPRDIKGVGCSVQETAVLCLQLLQCHQWLPVR